MTGEGEEGFLAHHNRGTRSERLKMFEVIRQVTQQITSLADGIIL
jgi:hypothetical protein